jgi:oligopeptide/dipeptide ABC transporter ATP-binding protein
MTTVRPAHQKPQEATADPLLRISGLTVDFTTDAGVAHVLSDVNLELARGETLGVVGESGSGKTVTALSILGLLGRSRTSGRIDFLGRNLLELSPKQLRQVRGKEIAMIFQEPRRSLDPAFTVGIQVAEVARRHLGLSRKDAWRRAVDTLDRVGIPSAEKRAHEYPHTFSGGMCQRVMLALAVVTSPQVLIADEATTALDVTVQARVLDLLRELQDEMGLAMLFITHDLAVVAEMSDHLAVMYGGQVVERGRTADVFRRPNHPYTEGLLASLPQRCEPGDALGSIPGQVPSPHAWPHGCRFAPRCPYAMTECTAAGPDLRAVDGRCVRCVRAEDLKLRGV